MDDFKFKRFEMSGVILFNARYVNTALLYLIRFETVSQPSFWNIGAEGAVKSACRNMRALERSNKNKKFRSFKSNENIHKKEYDWPYRGFGY